MMEEGDGYFSLGVNDPKTIYLKGIQVIPQLNDNKCR